VRLAVSSTIFAKSHQFWDEAHLTFGSTAVKRRLSWAAVVIAVVILLVIGIVIGSVWGDIGDSDISAAGWLAMGLGVVVTLALGIGLMALVFISNRRGYDEIGRRDI
jgi:hypothetical protein